MSAQLAVPLVGGRGELRLARQAALALLLLAVPVLALAGALQGLPGVLGGAAGLGLVGVLFGVSALAQGLAVRYSRSTLVTVMAVGFVARLAVYVAALQALGTFLQVHRPSLAIATAIGFVVTLHHEMRVINRTPELYWLELRSDDGGDRPARAGNSLMKRRS